MAGVSDGWRVVMNAAIHGGQQQLAAANQDALQTMMMNWEWDESWPHVWAIIADSYQVILLQAEPDLIFYSWSDDSLPAPPPCPDEDYWPKPPPLIVASIYQPLPYLPDPEEVPAGNLFISLSQDSYQVPILIPPH